MNNRYLFWFRCKPTEPLEAFTNQKESEWQASSTNHNGCPHLNLIKNCRDELSNLLTQQINYLEDGFKDLIRRLEEKKQYFTQNFDA